VMPRMRRPRARVVGFIAAAAVLGGVACTAIGTNFSPSGGKTATPSAGFAPDAVKSAPAPAAVGAPAVSTSAQSGAPGISPAAARDASSSNAASQAAASPPLTTVEQSSAAAAQSLDRKVIRNGQLAIELPDTKMEEALNQIRTIAIQSGGFVSASSTHVERVDNQDRTVADLTLQVRSVAADSAINALRGLGKVLSETSSSQDVTEEYVDISANLGNLRATEAAIVKLMDKATQIQDVLALQRELTNVRGQIDRLQGRQRFIDNRTEMTTISVSLRPPAPEGSPRPTGGWDPGAVAQRGWQASLAMLRGAAELVIVVLAFSWWLVPFVAAGGYWLVQRRRGQRVQPAAPTP
jgi:Domain of unknown function (DUF4349)